MILKQVWDEAVLPWHIFPFPLRKVHPWPCSFALHSSGFTTLHHLHFQTSTWQDGHQYPIVTVCKYREFVQWETKSNPFISTILHLNNCRTVLIALMGKSFLCLEAFQSATNSCSCYYLLLDSLIMSFTGRLLTFHILGTSNAILGTIRLLIQDRKPLPYYPSNLRIQEMRFLIQEGCFLTSAFSFLFWKAIFVIVMHPYYKKFCKVASIKNETNPNQHRVTSSTQLNMKTWNKFLPISLDIMTTTL